MIYKRTPSASKADYRLAAETLHPHDVLFWIEKIDVCALSINGTAAKDRPFAEGILVQVQARETVCNANIYSNKLIDKEQSRMELECV